MNDLKCVLLVAVLLFTRCGKRTPEGIVTWQLSKSDYSEVLTIAGTVQAVVNFPVMPPRSMYGQMRVTMLAADGSFVHQGDTICVLSVPELQSVYDNQVSTIEGLEADLKKKEADNRLNIDLLEAQLATSEAQLEISAIDSLRMTYASESQKRLYELGIQKARVEMQKTEKKLAASRKIGETELRQINMRIVQEKSRLQSMEEQLNAMTLTAKGDGYVTRTESPEVTILGVQGLGKLGGPVREGTVLFMNSPVLQFPDMSRMQVSAQVGEADFRRIEKGQKVMITVDASGKLNTSGSINRKSLIGKTVQRYSVSKVKWYEVIIDIDSCHARLKPGLSALCDITVREARDTLFVPNLAIFKKDSASVVYVLKKDRFLPVKVTSGLTGDSFTIVSAGLEGNETIALSEPPDRMLIKEKSGIASAGIDSLRNLKDNPDK